jgi:hypothetical protein
MSVPGVTTAIVEAASAATMDSYVKSFHYGWDTALPFVVVALLIAFALDGLKIKTQVTWLIERPVSSTILRIRWAIADFSSNVAEIHHIRHDEEHGHGERTGTPPSHPFGRKSSVTKP